MILMLLPESDYDPTESAVPWAALRGAGFAVRFATPRGRPAYADPRLVDLGFGPLSPLLMARPEAVARYREMSADEAFLSPLAYDDVDPDEVRALVIPGGHAPGMRTLIESETAQRIVRAAFAANKPVATVCHGVLLLARSVDPATGRSVLYGRRTTALPAWMELSAWWMTHLWLGRYYRTYACSVEAEVASALERPSHLVSGPWWPVRDTAQSPHRGFVVRDGNYLSARWPGDCHRLGAELVSLVRSHAPIRRSPASSRSA